MRLQSGGGGWVYVQGLGFSVKKLGGFRVEGVKARARNPSQATVACLNP